MNLAVSGQSHVAAAVAAVNNATTIDTSLLYQQNDHHQQQPISYKIPQVCQVFWQFAIPISKPVQFREKILRWV